MNESENTQTYFGSVFVQLVQHHASFIQLKETATLKSCGFVAFVGVQKPTVNLAMVFALIEAMNFGRVK